MRISSSLLQGHLHQKRCYSMQLVHHFHWIQADLQTCCEEERWALLCDVISQSYESKYDRLPLPHWQYDQQIKAPLLYFTQNLYLFIFSLYFLKSFFVYVGACLSKENTIVLESDAFIKCHCFCSKQPSNGCGRRSACVSVSVWDSMSGATEHLIGVPLCIWPPHYIRYVWQLLEAFRLWNPPPSLSKSLCICAVLTHNYTFMPKVSGNQFEFWTGKTMAKQS